MNEIIMLRVQFQIGHDAWVNACIVSILHPDRQNSFAVNSLETVPCSHIEFNNRSVVLRRVTSGNDYPSRRDLMQTEDLVLKELQHDRCKRCRYAVDFIEEQDTLTDTCVFHCVVDVCDDLTHRILGYLLILTDIVSGNDVWKTHCRFSGLVSHRVGDKVKTCFLSDLLHDSGLTDTRCAQQEYRTLVLDADLVVAELIFDKISCYGVLDLILCFFYVHNNTPSSVCSVLDFLSGGRSDKSPSSCISFNKNIIH